MVNNGEQEPQYLENKIKCPICGKWKNKTRKFYLSNKLDYDTFDHRCFYCIDCLNDMCFNKSGVPDIDGFKNVLENYLDRPFFLELYKKSLEDSRATLGAYNSRLNTGTYKNKDLRWADGETEEKKEQVKQQIINNIDNSQVTKEMIMTWGRGFDIDEYEFLDNELAEWEKTYKFGKRAELILLKEICITLLRIRIATESKDDVSKLQKDLQDLLKTASIDPAKANVADNGKSLDAFGVWIKDIEAKRPAEWWQEQEKYKDMDGFIPYIKNYIVRPIKNFITGNRDFQINDNTNVDIDNIDTDTSDEGDTNAEA